MAEEGRGEVEYVSLTDDGSRAARRFHERVRNPLLTDIGVDWAGLAVTDVYPKRIPDLFSAKPVVLTGRYTGSGSGTIKLKGKMGGRDFVREIPVNLPESEAEHDVLATLWARTRIDDLMSQDYSGMQQGAPKDTLKETITQLGLEYRLMTQFTSFVAVEEMVVTDGGQPRRIEVPVELPEGMKDENEMAVTEEVPVQAGTSGTANVSAGQLSNMPVQAAAQTVSATVPSGRSSRGAGTAKEKTDSKNPYKMSDKAGGEGIGARTDGSSSETLTPEQIRLREALAKMHPAVAAIVNRLMSKGTQPSADEAQFVHDGKAEIQVWLADKTPEALEELRRLGFEVVLDPKGSKVVIGRLPVEKLAALAELKSVRYVAPQLKR
jgi:hypothetical protein